MTRPVAGARALKLRAAVTPDLTENPRSTLPSMSTDGRSRGPGHGGRPIKAPAHAMLMALSIVAVMGMSGCAFTRGDVGLPFSEADLSAIERGRSTEADVVRALGAPDEIIRLGGGRAAFHYYHYAMKHGTVLVFTRVNIASDQVYVFFDGNGIVDEVLSSAKTDGLKFQYWPFGT